MYGQVQTGVKGNGYSFMEETFINVLASLLKRGLL